MLRDVDETDTVEKLGNKLYQESFCVHVFMATAAVNVKYISKMNL